MILALGQEGPEEVSCAGTREVLLTIETQESENNPKEEVLESAQSFIVATRTRTEQYSKKLTRDEQGMTDEGEGVESRGS